MALVYLNRLYNIGQDERSEQIENGLRNIRNSRFFVFYNGPRDPPLSQMVRAKVYTLLQVRIRDEGYTVHIVFFL